jgi:hypothetical protein
VPPELAAIKTLLDEDKEKGLAELTETELIAERDRLLEVLYNKYKDKNTKRDG